MSHARPVTEDDVSILWDGRRLDSKGAVPEWLAEVDAERAEEAADAAHAGMTDAEAQALPVQIDATALSLAGMTTWMTDAGPFDGHARLEASGGHRPTALRGARRARHPAARRGFAIHAAGLAASINAKTRADRPKDREALPELRALRNAAERNVPDAPRQLTAAR